MSLTQDEIAILSANQATLRTPKWNVYKRTLAAGETQTIRATGTAYYIKEADQSFLIGLDNGPLYPVDVGTGAKVTRIGVDAKGIQTGDFFTEMTVSNPTAVSLTVQIWIGVGDYIDNRFTLVTSRDFALKTMKAPTRMISSTTTTLAAAQTVTFSGAFTTPDRYRDALLVSNLDATLNINILDSLGNPGLVVFPKTSAIYPSSGVLKVNNPNGTGVSVLMSEIVYSG